MTRRLRALLLAVAVVVTATAASAPARATNDAACDTSPAGLLPRSPFADVDLSALPGEQPPYTYLLHVPEGLPRHDVPLLVAMHGLGGSSAQFAAQSRWAATADEHGFIVAFPNGLRKWDFREASPDVTFLRAVIADVRATRCIDGRRIWATGHSMGGFMAQRLACDAGDLVAAVASTAGGNVAMPGLGGPCAASGAPVDGYEPVPVGLWHGTADQLISYENAGRTTERLWAERYGCAAVADVRQLPHGTRDVHGSCTRDDIVAQGPPRSVRFAVELRTYVDHRHGYPDGCGGLGELSREPCEPDPATWPTADSHNAEIHHFLASHPRRTPAPASP